MSPFRRRMLVAGGVLAGIAVLTLHLDLAILLAIAGCIAWDEMP